MSRSRRPSISIHDYPEHLNPFNDESRNSQPQMYRDSKATTKDSKHKFWTFGRSRKKRSNSFSIKSTWSGLFGKRKDAPEVSEKRSTITTVSSTYKRETCTRPAVPPRSSKDQQEFDEALGTLARRRKYTFDPPSRSSSILTVNGDPARIYDGSPQDTTTSIMGELTPKPPARRFGQVSPKPTDKIPRLDFEEKGNKENGSVTLREKNQENTPVPPLRKFGNRSSQRMTAPGAFHHEEEENRSGDVTLCDENENVPEDYIFKRFSQDAVRKSNLSINSCISIGSTASTYGRKKRRAPQPPRRVEQVETVENVVQKSLAVPSIELQIVEPIDITRVTENIDEMTKKNQELSEVSNEEQRDKLSSSVEEEKSEENTTNDSSSNVSKIVGEETKLEESKENTAQIKETEENTSKEKNDKSIDKTDDCGESKIEENVEIQYRRTSQENLEIIKDVDQINSEEVGLRRKNSSEALSRSDSFSVKEEIEKIERQIKVLEIRNSSKDSFDNSNFKEANNSRQSLQANRRHFFQNMVDTDKDGLKIELKELPREQNNIHVVRLTDSPVPVVAPRESVKVIELHISEPIKRKPEILDDVNPIPKPRRNSALSLQSSPTNVLRKEKQKDLESTRGKSF